MLHASDRWLIDFQAETIHKAELQLAHSCLPIFLTAARCLTTLKGYIAARQKCRQPYPRTRHRRDSDALSQIGNPFLHLVPVVFSLRGAWSKCKRNRRRSELTDLTLWRG